MNTIYLERAINTGTTRIGLFHWWPCCTGITAGLGAHQSDRWYLCSRVRSDQYKPL